MIRLFKKDKVEEDQILNVLMRISIFWCTGIAIATIYEKSEIASLLFHASFFLNMISFITCIQQKEMTKNMDFIVRVFLLIIACGIASIISFSLTFDYMKKFIIYITVLSSFFVASNISASKKTVTLLLLCNALLSILYIIKSQEPGAYIGKTLWLYFDNPNFAGMWLSMTAMLLVVIIPFLKNKVIKTAIIFLAGYIMYLCYETGARNVILAVAYMAILVIYCIFSKKKQFSPKTIIFLNLFPLIFAIAYVIILRYGGFSTWLVERVSAEGKSINSRYEIWLYALHYIKYKLIFGAYRYINGGTGNFQLHNTHLDTWASYGTVGITLFLLYIYKIIQSTNVKSRGIKSMLALSGFIVMLLIGTGEAGLYATGMGMYIFVASFLLISDYFSKAETGGKDV